MTAMDVGAGAAPKALVSGGLGRQHRPCADALVPGDVLLLLPLIGSELGLSYTEIGSILTSSSPPARSPTFPAAYSSTRSGRKGLLMAVSLFWVGFPYLGDGIFARLLDDAGVRAMVGIGNNLWHPTAIPWLAGRFPERRGLVMSFHSMGANVGDALAPLAVGALLTILSWRDVVLINVVPGHRDVGADPQSISGAIRTRRTPRPPRRGSLPSAARSASARSPRC